MKVLVTGGLGQLSRLIVRELTSGGPEKLAHDVTIFDRRAGRVPGVRTVVGNHEDLSAVADASEGADAILHLSATHPKSGLTDSDMFRSNVLGVRNVHEAAKIHGVRRVVHWSSVAALGWSGRNENFMPDYLPIDEDHPLRATDAYGLSKAAGEAIAESYSDRFGMETVALRHVWAASLRDVIQLNTSGGKRHGHWIHYAYLDARDASVAARLALEAPLSGHTALYLAADDSCAPTPLAELLTHLRPEIGELAASLTPTQSAISNARAKSVLGWQPAHTWRTRVPVADHLRVGADRLVSAVAKHVPTQWFRRLGKHAS